MTFKVLITFFTSLPLISLASDCQFAQDTSFVAVAQPLSEVGYAVVEFQNDSGVLQPTYDGNGSYELRSETSTVVRVLSGSFVEKVIRYWEFDLDGWLAGYKVVEKPRARFLAIVSQKNVSSDASIKVHSCPTRFLEIVSTNGIDYVTNVDQVGGSPIADYLQLYTVPLTTFEQLLVSKPKFTPKELNCAIYARQRDETGAEIFGKNDFESKFNGTHATIELFAPGFVGKFSTKISFDNSLGDNNISASVGNDRPKIIKLVSPEQTLTIAEWTLRRGDVAVECRIKSEVGY